MKREVRIVRLTKETFESLENALKADERFSTSEHFPSLMFYAPDGKQIIFVEG